MRDPLLIDAWKTEIAPDQRKHYQNDELTNNELRRGLNEAHDRIRKLTTANNQLVNRYGNLQRRREWEKIWTRIVTCSMLAAWAVIGWLLKAFLSR